MAKNQPIDLIGIDDKPSLDIAALQKKLTNQTGRKFWRSLDEIAQTPEFQRYVHDEFPHWASRLSESVSRRNFLKLMGASMALAGLSGCNSILHPQPLEKIAPYTRQPVEITPGTPLFFATSMVHNGVGIGLLAESHMGRPTKMEGNPDHPGSMGGSNAFAQASILTMYDPERSQAVRQLGRFSSWPAFVETITQEMETARNSEGAGLRILTETVASPTLANQITTLLEELPQAKWYQYEPVSRDNVRAGAEMAFGEAVQTHYDFSKAKVILSLDADFLSTGPGSLRYAHDFSGHRLVREGVSETDVNRLYAVESTPSGTGSIADHRLPLNATEVELFAREIAAAVGYSVETSNAMEAHIELINAIVQDLQAHPGESLVVAGEYQSPAVHALAHAINETLGNVGETVIYTEPMDAAYADQIGTISDLAADMEAGNTDLLVIIGGNPAFDAPAELDFGTLLQTIRNRIHVSLYEDETSALCQWHVPASYYLEQWSDARTHDGTVGIVQPLITPLYDGRSAHEIIALMLGNAPNDFQTVQEYWQNQLADADDFDAAWQTAVHDGYMADTALPSKSVTLNSDLGLPEPQPSEGLEITFRPDPTLWDGRYANNGWLQEIPKPITKLTWDNAALISPVLAAEMSLSNGDMVELLYQERSIEMPVWIVPGQARNTVTVHFGYGRSQVGQVGEGTGFDVYPLRTAESPWFGTGLELNPTGGYYELISTQNHGSMEGRDLIRTLTLNEFLNPHDEHDGHHYQSLQPGHPYDGYHWGAVFDLSNCIDCGACVAACNAENNIAIVGKEEVSVGREMHWLRIDRYFEGDLENPKILHQPVLCMQCEQAPCEVVCPVAATVHSAEGLNDMVYNRCVGTRFCANNCPYKVRRFNFYQYQETEVPVIELRHNPEVTVRSRGVMEKCTYCVQRIQDARTAAKRDGTAVPDGSIQLACQQACPMQGSVFGDISNEQTAVAQTRSQPHNYSLLAELNTKPRTTYLAKVTNPNPALSGGSGEQQEESGGH